MVTKPNAAAIIGLSGSGKTTLIEALIRLYVARGWRVAAIKHTHHPLNDRDEGDTARFGKAGAETVIFASDGEAILFPSRAAIQYVTPLDLLGHARSVDVVLIEGFKSFDGWPRIEVVRGVWRSADEVAAMLDKIWRSS